MSWGCKPENKPYGCGWSDRITYPRLGWTTWWCETCERGGDVLIEPTRPHPTHTEHAGDNEGVAP